MTRPPDIVHFTREEFLAERWDARAGQHVTILGPTDSGKTHFSYQLLHRAIRPSLPGLVLCMKPRDETVTDWSRTLGLRTVHQWPPPPMGGLFRSRPRGWTVWPKHTFDPDIDDPHLRLVFRSAILDSYKRGGRIVFADEVAGLSTELALHKELKTMWMRGRSMGTGMWSASQRPVDVPLLAYSSAEHLFLAHEPDLRGRQRYDEIGGIDAGRVRDVVARLRKWEFLYIRRTGRRVCVVGP